MIIKFDKYIESRIVPDHFEYEEDGVLTEYDATDEYTYSFSIQTDGNLYLSKESEYHSEMMIYMDDNGKKHKIDDLKIIDYNNSPANGRIWVEKKAMAFWKLSMSINDFITEIKTQFKRQYDVDFDVDWK